ncbi:MAG: hypothetical protein IH845_04500 [Nanoarchaeota archaeon]|nr:hypothetical protein [Nanoarchaeota archaeon]
MRKSLVVFVFVLLFMSFVLSLEHINVEGDAEKLQKAIDENLPIDPDTGEFVNPLGKTKAEERIDKINLWFSENASWLRAVFGMVPELSWLFLFVIYFWLLFLVVLVLNANLFSIFLDKTKSRILGGLLFLILIVTKILFNIGKFFHSQAAFIYNYGWIGVVILIVLLLILAWFFPQAFYAIGKYAKDLKERRAKEQEGIDRRVIHTIAEGATEE